MKTVLPLLTGLSYDGLEIAEGSAASEAFMRMAFGIMTEEERGGMKDPLERYCGLDTYGMVVMIEKLGTIA